MKKTLIFMILIFFITTGTTYASTVATGVTVKAIGDSTTVGITEIKDGKTWIKYFIPLDEDYSGIYGVDPFPGFPGVTIGTQKDQGIGYGPDALTMYIEYSPVEFPASEAILTFEFLDLDLDGASDPDFFFETIQVFNSTGSAVTPVIDETTDSTSDFTIAVDSFGEVSITIHDFTSSVLNPTFVELVFSSDYSGYCGWNTEEYLYTTLKTTAAVPIPGAVWLLGSGLLGLAGIRRKLRG